MTACENQLFPEAHHVLTLCWVVAAGVIVMTSLSYEAKDVDQDGDNSDTVWDDIQTAFLREECGSESCRHDEEEEITEMSKRDSYTCMCIFVCVRSVLSCHPLI